MKIVITPTQNTAIRCLLTMLTRISHAMVTHEEEDSIIRQSVDHLHHHLIHHLNTSGHEGMISMMSVADMIDAEEVSDEQLD